MQELRAGPGCASNRTLQQSGCASPRAPVCIISRTHRHAGQLGCVVGMGWGLQDARVGQLSTLLQSSCVCSTRISSSTRTQSCPGVDFLAAQPARLLQPTLHSSPNLHSRCGAGWSACSHASLVSNSSCSFRKQRRSLSRPANQAGRLTPPNASLAFAEPATAITSASAAATAASSLSFSKVLAVVLGYCVMAGSLFRSVPQIIKVVKHNSTEGLSLMSYLVELCCYTVVIAYNVSQGYGFNTFGEVVACWIQDIILITLVFRDRNTPLWLVLLAAAAFTAGCSFLLSPSCPQRLLSTLQASNIAVMALGSRLPQIILNMRRGNAGMLSVTTCLLNVAGNTARIFTTLVLTGDVLMLGAACSQGCLNTILLFQSVSTARARKAMAASSSSSSAPPSEPPAPQQHGPAIDVSGGPDAAAGGYQALQPAT